MLNLMILCFLVLLGCVATYFLILYMFELPTAVSDWYTRRRERKAEVALKAMKFDNILVRQKNSLSLTRRCCPSAARSHEINIPNSGFCTFAAECWITSQD
jgi:hypothetical protein